MNIDSLGGRRFLLAVGCGFVCALLLCIDKLSDSSFTMIIMGTVGAYIASDTFSRHSETKADVQKTLGEPKA